MTTIKPLHHRAVFCGNNGTKIDKIPKTATQGKITATVLGTKCNPPIKTVTKPNPAVVKMTLPHVKPNSTFSGCRGLSHLVIGESVELIDMNAFLGCQNLTDLMLPNSLKRINPQAFYDCANLSSVSFGDSISYIGYYAFYGCVNISKVNITNLATWCNVEFDYGESNPLCYSHSLYLNNQEIKNLVIPDHITKIKNKAFNGCSGLTSLTVPNGTLIIGENSFSDLISSIQCSSFDCLVAG